MAKKSKAKIEDEAAAKESLPQEPFEVAAEDEEVAKAELGENDPPSSEPWLPRRGDTVLYVLREGEVRPAIVTSVLVGSLCNLAVLLDGPNDSDVRSEYCGPSWRGTVEYSEDGEVGTWHGLEDS